MKEISIKKNEAGQRFDKYLKKFFSEAPQSFIYKMLRKKNIVLNGKKADGSEILNENDNVKFFLADDTIEKFQKEQNIPAPSASAKKMSHSKLFIIYEDDDILFANKRVGQLSQKAKEQDYSINEEIMDYLIQNNTLTADDLKTFRPSVCNRLDRNTSGIITFGKSLKGLQMLSSGLKDRTIDKYYLCVVKGVVTERSRVNAYLTKDEKSNKVSVTSEALNKDSDPIITEYIPYKNNGNMTLLKIKLHTGKTHQIRAHLAWLNHPLIGDVKYGDNKLNQKIDQQYKINYQLLHAFEMYLPQYSNRYYAMMPQKMLDFLKKEGLWEPGSQEALEALH